ncbi:TLC domain-containing protein 2 [Lingula anatina]|uniref:TLC domain-containing protein 2 n=1 Tax=Lingula anatina TaxID=7574 RepID=A0A1S3J1H2_LINAN|nr:TLC domain-containing protein 2 [Lingula anatina]|eukprot:XP_013403669.1 TLC domain-containing protein 2 [Lingula anatina]
MANLTTSAHSYSSMDTGTKSTDIPLEYGPLVVLTSALCFQAASKVVDLIGIPKSAQDTEFRRWRFKNITISLLHSALTGPWSLLCFYLQPKLAEDLISTYSVIALTLVSTSVGYFVHDIIDMAWSYRNRQNYELMLHHAVGIICFGVAVVYHRYMGYAVVALIVELNSIFLHIRQLLLICKVPKTSSIYRLTSLINIGTFIMFRISTMAWMTRWLVYNRDKVPFLMFTLGSLGMAIMTVMNIVLFCRILYSDFFRKGKLKKTD